MTSLKFTNLNKFKMQSQNNKKSICTYTRVYGTIRFKIKANGSSSYVPIETTE